ncbi:MAG TPA: hypothetical protein VIK89_14030, partial [Cytophagaceae bacterium]
PSSMDNLKGIIFQGCPQWSFQFMQGFLSSGTLGFYCTKNTHETSNALLFYHFKTQATHQRA